MNKKELAAFKKEFKLDSYKLKLKELYCIYLKKDNLSVIHTEKTYFEVLDTETQELYLNNFKKLLSGSIDTKIFQLGFMDSEEENSSQKLLYTALENEMELHDNLDKLIVKIGENYKYDTDIVISFIKGEYYQASNKKTDEDNSSDDTMNAFKFIMGSINKVEAPKKALLYDYENQKLRANSSLDIIININAPLEGFMFPTIDNGYSDVNKVLYYTGKPKDKNVAFIEDILNCKLTLTAMEEKDSFSAILSSVTGGKTTPTVMQEIYEAIQEKAEEATEDETPSIGVKDLQNILKAKNIELKEDVDLAFEEVLATKEHEFKIQNILPKFDTKSMKLTSESTDIIISPKDLSMIKQVKDKDGNKCLLIRLEEDMLIDGLSLDTEDSF